MGTLVRLNNVKINLISKLTKIDTHFVLYKLTINININIIIIIITVKANQRSNLPAASLFFSR